MRRTRPARRDWFVRLVNLLHHRPDIRHVHPFADTIDEAARWNA